MSITITSDATDHQILTCEEPCLCAQMCDSWGLFFDGDHSPAVRAELARGARPACPHCKGTGVYAFERTDRPELNWSNANAVRLFAAMGILFDYVGDMPIAEARRAVMVGRARGSLDIYARPHDVTYGKPRQSADGTTLLYPVRLVDCPLSGQDIAERIERFAALVEESARRGASLISWY